MHRSTPSYENKNPFVVLRDVNVVCNYCNEVGHKSYESRRKIFQSSGGPFTSSFNKNVKCYYCQKYGHIAKHCKLRTAKRRKMSTMETKTKSN